MDHLRLTATIYFVTLWLYRSIPAAAEALKKWDGEGERTGEGTPGKILEIWVKICVILVHLWVKYAFKTEKYTQTFTLHTLCSRQRRPTS